jgi:hypothetical protein
VDITNTGTLDVQRRTFQTAPNKATGTKYQYKVLAFNGVAWGALSPPSSIFVAAVPPTAPLNVLKIASTTNSATVGWSVPSNNGGTPIVGYLIYSDGGSGNGTYT